MPFSEAELLALKDKYPTTTQALKACMPHLVQITIECETPTVFEKQPATPLDIPSLTVTL